MIYSESVGHNSKGKVLVLAMTVDNYALQLQESIASMNGLWPFAICRVCLAQARVACVRQ
jgi:hypothetical protein